jgi:hypothetical protein
MTHLLLWMLNFITPNSSTNLPNCMEHSPSWEADSCLDIQTFPAFYKSLRFITVTPRTHHWSIFLTGWIRCTPCFFKIHFKMFLPSTPRSLKWSLLYSWPQRVICSVRGRMLRKTTWYYMKLRFLWRHCAVLSDYKTWTLCAAFFSGINTYGRSFF